MEPTTRDVVEAAGACFNSRDFDGLDVLVADYLVNHAGGPQGREGWKQIWRAIIASFPDAVAETRMVIVEDDRAAVHMILKGTHQASAMPLLEGLAPTNKYIEWEFIHLFRLEHGRIVEHSAVRDDHGLRRQLGAAGP
jgi:predicted ester cyclase